MRKERERGEGREGRERVPERQRCGCGPGVGREWSTGRGRAERFAQSCRGEAQTWHWEPQPSLVSAGPHHTMTQHVASHCRGDGRKAEVECTPAEDGGGGGEEGDVDGVASCLEHQRLRKPLRCLHPQTRSALAG
eukprot:2238440-Rhodomonas_salina.1